MLHNIGNVLNSVNISNGMATSAIEDIDVSVLQKVASKLAKQQEANVSDLKNDDGMQHVPKLLLSLCQSIELQKDRARNELSALAGNTAFIGKIVQSHQAYTTSVGQSEEIMASELFRNALNVVGPSRAEYVRRRRFTDLWCTQQPADRTLGTNSDHIAEPRD